MTDAATPPRRRRGPWHRLRRHRGALAGGGLFALIVAAVALGPWLWPLDPGYIDIRARNAGPGLAHPLGTDHLGRDMLARMLAGGRVSIATGLGAMLLGVGLGTLVGVLAGLFRRLDGPLMRLTDLFLALPLIPLVLVAAMLFRETLAQRLGPETGIFLLVVIAIGATSWMPAARLVRGEVLALKERDFIRAARALGTGDLALVTRHILPNAASPILVSATLGMATAILTESALSFLGLGFPPDFPTWGRLLSDAVAYLPDHPGRALWPGGLISLTVLGVNYLGEGLRDALDPRGRA